MNSLQPAVIEVKQQHNTVKEYWQGFDSFVSGALLEEMSTAGERRGWWAACEAEAEAMSPGYAESQGW